MCQLSDQAVAKTTALEKKGEFFFPLLSMKIELHILESTNLIPDVIQLILMYASNTLEDYTKGEPKYRSQEIRYSLFWDEWLQTIESNYPVLWFMFSPGSPGKLQVEKNLHSPAIQIWTLNRGIKMDEILLDPVEYPRVENFLYKRMQKFFAKRKNHFPIDWQ